jgi:hypothetical protein
VDGFGNELPDSDDHSVNLFQPSITFDKTGDTLSKVGDSVDYTITLENTSSDDSPSLTCHITDPLLGVDKSGISLAWNDPPYVINTSRVVQPGDPDPLVNTASVLCTVEGFGNELPDSDDHSVNLFQPDYSLSCWTASDIATVGDTIEYLFTLDDLSSPDTPNMARVSASSNLLGDVASSFPDPLVDKVVYLYYTVQASDPAMLVHGVTTVYSPLGFPNEYERYAQCTVQVKFGCMYSPGYWGGGEGVQKWDQSPCDPVAAAAGFITTDEFPWYDYGKLGGDDPTPGDSKITYLDIFGLPKKGDVTRQLAFKYVAARLNVALADVLSLPVHSDLVPLLDEIDLYFASYPVGSRGHGDGGWGKSLKTQLDAIFAAVGEEYCPPTGSVPECP